MKMQSGLVFGLIFAMVNMESVPVNYVFGEAMWPLVLILLELAVRKSTKWHIANCYKE